MDGAFDWKGPRKWRTIISTETGYILASYGFRHAMKTAQHVLIAVALAIHPTIGHSLENKWQRYLNPRFGFALDVPANFIPQPEPENGDGQTWKSPDGRGTITAFGHNGSSEIGTDYEQVRAEAKTDSRNAYFAEGRNWFVVSGTSGPDVYYIKTVRSEKCGSAPVLELHLNYPSSQKSSYDSVVARAASSFTDIVCGKDLLVPAE
jgi:hypothetical protein